MLLERTPYDANFFVKKEQPHLRDAAWSADRAWVDDGYILVVPGHARQVRLGRQIRHDPPADRRRSTRRRPTTPPTRTTPSTGSPRTCPRANSRVGMIGSSYDGWTVTMALLGPHPALKVAAPESPMVDGWMGDDWFHYGAFRQANLDYLTGQTSVTGKGDPVPRTAYDDYQAFLDAGSAGAYAVAHGFDQLPFWRRLAGPPGLRRLLAGPGVGQADRRPSPRRPDHVAAGPVGPGGHVRRHPHLGRAARCECNPERPPRDGPLVSQPGQPQRRLARSPQVEGRHRRRLPPRCAGSLLRHLPEGRAPSPSPRPRC